MQCNKMQRRYILFKIPEILIYFLEFFIFLISYFDIQKKTNIGTNVVEDLVAYLHLNRTATIFSLFKI